ncbi:hypothetical protein TIFTF001_027882 [Ficus carica]|uniref:Uncharacterized protein n=1 Tax=Ficus carica TaxID=3494 RepID=A0AA88DP80_FICCA|nr:hypothetical protein TIFTF001_027882 [Ficus carica]
MGTASIIEKEKGIWGQNSNAMVLGMAIIKKGRNSTLNQKTSDSLENVKHRGGGRELENEMCLGNGDYMKKGGKGSDGSEAGVVWDCIWVGGGNVR